MRIYQDDYICPYCVECDKENDLCRIGRWRYPTDGCFDFRKEGEENALTQVLAALRGEEVKDEDRKTD